MQAIDAGDRPWTTGGEKGLGMEPSQTPVSETPHRKIAAQCFNACWGILDRSERTVADVRELVLLAHTSLWHWTQVPDHTSENIAVGWWMVSRAQAVAGNGVAARDAALASAEASGTDCPFLAGYADEALARAALVSGDRDIFSAALASARRWCEAIEKPDEKSLLDADLLELESRAVV
jgi:hypothetical protein